MKSIYLVILMGQWMIRDHWIYDNNVGYGNQCTHCGIWAFTCMDVVYVVYLSNYFMYMADNSVVTVCLSSTHLFSRQLMIWTGPYLQLNSNCLFLSFCTCPYDIGFEPLNFMSRNVDSWRMSYSWGLWRFRMLRLHYSSSLTSTCLWKGKEENLITHSYSDTASVAQRHWCNICHIQRQSQVLAVAKVMEGYWRHIDNPGESKGWA